MRCNPLAVVVLLLLAVPCVAWNKPGHMVSAGIAYDVMKKERPAQLAQVLDVLRQHPQYADTFAKKLDAVDEDQRDRYLFMLAARWPDDVRTDKTYHRGPWHYINYPIIPPGDVGHVKPPAPAAENILTAIKLNADTLQDNTKAPGERAFAACWLLHLIGDVHQPLHTVSLFSRRMPEGDRGGNSFTVRVREDRAVINLHTFWDGLLTSSQRYKTVGNMAIELRNRPDFARDKLDELTSARTPEQWAKESAAIATHTAYVDGTLQGGTTDADAATLPDGYTDQAKAIGERRIVLAGYRIADTLAVSP